MCARHLLYHLYQTIKATHWIYYFYILCWHNHVHGVIKSILEQTMQHKNYLKVCNTELHFKAGCRLVEGLYISGRALINYSLFPDVIYSEWSLILGYFRIIFYVRMIFIPGCQIPSFLDRSGSCVNLQGCHCIYSVFYLKKSMVRQHHFARAAPGKTTLIK